MTETSPVSTQTRSTTRSSAASATVGRPGPHVEMQVVDPDTGLVVQRGEPGELCTRGYSVMLGLLGGPREDRRGDRRGALDAHRRPGDDGRRRLLNIVGRIKDMVIRGGENVYPREIEEFLYGHEDIADVSVVGVPDERYGEELCACVVTRRGGAARRGPVREFCRGRLAHYKVPRYVLFADEFPMTVTGKVQKFKMRDDSIERLGLQEAAAVRSA